MMSTEEGRVHQAINFVESHRIKPSGDGFGIGDVLYSQEIDRFLSANIHVEVKRIMISREISARQSRRTTTRKYMKVITTVLLCGTAC